MSLLRRWRWPAVLAALVYPAALLTQPGRMPADSKLYLYLNPADLLGRATTTWDTSQFGGFVPHQQIAYVWPAGPWFWVMDALHVPDWVAHRLWVATLLWVAGMGVMWFARTLNLSPMSSAVAAIIYMLSPYTVAYVSRTSVMLLPWAGLGWVMGMTRAALRTGRWREPAIIALIVVTIGSTNATALAVIIPGPVLMVVDDLLARRCPWRRAVRAVGRITVLSVGVSMWWVAMLVVQGRYGAQVLAYTETLEAVSSTSISPETLRGLGYWLNYVRDHVQATTDAASTYHTNVAVITAGYLVMLAGAAGVVLTNWRHRRLAALLILIGTLIAVGVYPFTRPAPIFAAATEHSRSTLALALRSSTRALPLSILGVALGAAALTNAVASVQRRRLVAAAVVVGAVVNMPSLFTGKLVDRYVSRAQDPPVAWRDAAAALDTEGRVLQLPGAEFGAYRWGYTVDPALPGLTASNVLTRDLQPLGSAAAMDLLYAFDNRLQDGIDEIGSYAPIARLLAVDTWWLTNDTAFERFMTTRPEVLRQRLAALGVTIDYGVPVANTPGVAMIDEQSVVDAVTGTNGSAVIGVPLAPVTLIDVDSPVGVARVKDRVVIVAGSGDGLVDAAAAGLLTGDELTQYSASADDPMIENAAMVIITDSNRDRAQQWRGSQATVGFTEDGLPGADVLRFDPQDQRLPVFDGSGESPGRSTMTWADQRGPARATASSYGQVGGYWPEYRPAMALDDDPNTAWKVGAFGNPIGEYLTIDFDLPVASLVLTQPGGDRSIRVVDIAAVDAATGATTTTRHDLGTLADVLSGSPRTVTLASPSSSVTLTIAATTPGSDGVGFSTVAATRDAATGTESIGPVTEVVVMPVDATQMVDEQRSSPSVAVVMTRLRVRGTDRLRQDPEPVLRRQFRLPEMGTGASGGHDYSMSVDVRIDSRVTDAALAALLGLDTAAGASVPASSSHLAGSLVNRAWAATDGNDATAWVSAFGEPTPWIEFSVPPGTESIAIAQPTDPGARQQLRTITRVTVERNGQTLSSQVDGTTPIAIPSGDGPVRLTIAETSASSPTSTIDRRSGQPVLLPVAITEIVGADGTVTPPALNFECRNDVLTIDANPIALRLTGNVANLLAGAPFTAAPCDALALAAGDHLVESFANAGLSVDRVVLANNTPAITSDAVTLDVRNDRTSRRVTVPPCPRGCWVVLAEGFSTGWSATANTPEHGGAARELAHLTVDGGWNGWYISPTDSSMVVTMKWAGQRPVDVAMLLSALCVIGCVAVVVVGSRRRQRVIDDAGPPIAFRFRPSADVRATTTTALVASLATVTTSWLCIGALAALVAIAAIIALAVLAKFTGRDPRRTLAASVGGAGLAGLVVGAAYVIAEAIRHDPAPGAAFLSAVSNAHQPMMLAVVMIAVSACATASAPTASTPP